ncbi:hypothetical protein BC943DRAFT_312875 [Umbelopsis sp. AD052]|nr:hypothetical protein BC943DRAFT_312875 [Umbelopsis sp. AD052]
MNPQPLVILFFSLVLLLLVKSSHWLAQPKWEPHVRLWNYAHYSFKLYTTSNQSFRIRWDLFLTVSPKCYFVQSTPLSVMYGAI